MLDVEFTSKNSVAATSLPLLQRNLRHRQVKLTSTRGQQVYRCTEATSESNSMLKAFDMTAEFLIVDSRPRKKPPFLKRNICSPQHLHASKSRRKDRTAIKKATCNSSNARLHYGVHFVKNANDDTTKKNTILTSFYCPAYQCPICLSYEGVSENQELREYHIESLTFFFQTCIFCQPG